MPYPAPRTDPGLLRDVVDHRACHHLRGERRPRIVRASAQRSGRGDMPLAPRCLGVRRKTTAMHKISLPKQKKYQIVKPATRKEHNLRPIGWAAGLRWTTCWVPGVTRRSSSGAGPVWVGMESDGRGRGEGSSHPLPPPTGLNGGNGVRRSLPSMYGPVFGPYRYPSYLVNMPGYFLEKKILRSERARDGTKAEQGGER